MDFLGIGATILGGLLGGKNKGSTTTAKQEPWGPAQQYLIDNLATNKQLQDWYQQNPFNPQQKQAYQNLYADQDNFRGNVAPGLMQFANNMMGSQYRRQAPARPGGAAGYTGGLLGPAPPQQPAERAQVPQTGLLSANRPGPFSVAPSTPYGQINWNAQNPFYKTPEQLAEEARLKALAAQQQAQQLTYDPDWYQMYMTGLGASGGDGGAAVGDDGGGPGVGDGSTI